MSNSVDEEESFFLCDDLNMGEPMQEITYLKLTRHCKNRRFYGDMSFAR